MCIHDACSTLILAPASGQQEFTEVEPELMYSIIQQELRRALGDAPPEQHQFQAKMIRNSKSPSKNGWYLTFVSSEVAQLLGSGDGSGGENTIFVRMNTHVLVSDTYTYILL